jgi:hypothetical protein
MLLNSFLGRLVRSLLRASLDHRFFRGLSHGVAILVANPDILFPMQAIHTFATLADISLLSQQHHFPKA